jgi:hypothetical protein
VEQLRYAARHPLLLNAFTLETWFRRDGTGTAATTGTGGIARFIPLVTRGAAEAENSNVDANYLLGLNAGGPAGSTVLAADFEEGAGQASPGLNHPISGVRRSRLTGTTPRPRTTVRGGGFFLNGVLEAEQYVGQLPRADSQQHAALGTMLGTGRPSTAPGSSTERSTKFASGRSRARRPTSAPP